MSEDISSYLEGILPTDKISRCITFGKFFHNGRATQDLLWKLHPRSGDNGLYRESGVLRSLAVNDDEVHQIGCSIAAGQNLRVRGTKGEKWKPSDQKYYCGFRTALVSEIISIIEMEEQSFKVKLTLLPEKGIESHVDVSVKINLENSDDRALARAEASLALAEAFGPPVPYRCPCDEEDLQHPFERFGCDCLVVSYNDKWTTEELAKGTYIR